jgi:NitT/TauT family transport system substrate-binding protein
MTSLARPLAAAIVMACGWFITPARGDEPQTLSVAIGPSITSAVLYVADKEHFFQQEGIKIAWVNIESMTTMVGPLGTGQVDVGVGAIAAGLYNAIARKIDIKVVADMGSDPPGYGFQQFLVRTDLVKSGRYKKVADLKGMTVAGNTPGSTSSSLLNQLLKTGGLKFDDVNRVFMGYSEHIMALKNGAVDASLMPEPNASAAIALGAAVRIMGNDQYYPNQEVAVIAFGRNLLKNRPLAMRFMRAYLRAARFYNDGLAHGRYEGPNGPEIIKDLTETMPIKDAAVYRAVTPSGVNPDGHVYLQSMRTDLAFFKEHGLVTGPIEAEDIVDDSYAEEAAKALGPYHKKGGS